MFRTKYFDRPPPMRPHERFAQVAFFVMVGIFAVVAAAALVQAAYGQVPQQDGPIGGPPSAGEIELGRVLFFDPLLSANGSVSCSTCHVPELGYTDGLRVAVGINNQAGTMNTPTCLGSSYMPVVFWDGRTAGFEAQALLPLENPIEMGRQTTADVVNRLRGNVGYMKRFLDVFGDARSPIDDVKISRAIASFQSTLVSSNAPIDRYLRGEKDALTPDAKIGWELVEKANCVQCHRPPLWTTNLFANDGTEFATKGRLQFQNGQLVVVTSDQGRFNVTRQGVDRRSFKIPTLREIQRTAPYGHNGEFPDLERVIRHKNSGGKAVFKVQRNGQAVDQVMRDTSIDPRIKPLGWTAQQEKYVVTFLKQAFAGAHFPLVEAPELPR